MKKEGRLLMPKLGLRSLNDKMVIFVLVFYLISGLFLENTRVVLCPDLVGRTACTKIWMKGSSMSVPVIY